MFEVTVLDLSLGSIEVGTFDIARPTVGQAIDEIGAIVVEIVELNDAAQTATIAIRWAD